MLFLILLLVSQVLSQDLGQEVTVVTPIGSIVGQKAADGNYTTFYGVPYAKVDENRPFQDTLNVPAFTTPFNASNPFIKCPQALFSEEGILQCLILNIYVPTNASNLPVYVWFPGGGFAFGSAGEYNAKHLVDQDIIAITANYRLGPYGFLCTHDIKNQGLNDMKKALLWVKNNIKSFGGDPSKVTIGGESYGAGAVDYLLYSDAVFQQAIIESGSRYSYGISTRRDCKMPIKLAAQFGEHFNNSEMALNFLNKADPIDVMRATKNLSIVFGVCEKSAGFYLTGKNYEKIRNTPILIGYNSKEAFGDFAIQNASFYTGLRDEFFGYLYKTFSMKNETLSNMADIIWRFYLGAKPISQESMLDIIDLSSDFRVNYGAERSTSVYLKSGNPKVYKYVFSYTGGSPFKNMTGVGAYHTEELPYLFEWGTPLQTEEQFALRRWMVKMWTNFIKYGDPTPNHGEHGWLPTTVKSREYLDIDVQSEMMKDVYHQRMAFWDLLWMAYGRYRKTTASVVFV